MKKGCCVVIRYVWRQVCRQTWRFAGLVEPAEELMSEWMTARAAAPLNLAVSATNAK
jgi:hypothetical protein